MPDQVEGKSLEDDNFVDMYDLHRLVRVKENEDRMVRCKERRDERKRRRLRDLLDVGEKALVVAERLKRKMHQVIYTRALQRTDHSSTETDFLQ